MDHNSDLHWLPAAMLGKVLGCWIIIVVILVDLLGVRLAFAEVSRRTGPDTRFSLTPEQSNIAQATTGGSSQDQFNRESDRLTELLKFLADKFPTGKENQRETAFSILAVAYLAILGGSISLPVAGSTVGGGIGGLVGAAGLVTGPAGALTIEAGALIGAGIGGGAGLLATTATWIGASLMIIPVLLYINERYPEVALAPDIGGVRRVALGDRSVQRRQTLAGPWESIMIHLLDSYYTDKIVLLAQQWDQLPLAPPNVQVTSQVPFITQSQRNWLQQHAFLRPLVAQLAYIKQTKRISPSAPVARPLSGLLGEVVKLITADSASMRQAWFSVLGLTGIKAAVKSGTLTINTPEPLVQVGAPPSSRIQLPQINVKSGGAGTANDPYVAVVALSGPFDILWGVPEIIGNRIKLNYRIMSGATLASAQLSYRWGDKSGAIGPAFSPKTTGNHDAAIYLRPEGHILVVDRVELGGTPPIQLGMPQASGPLAPLGNLINGLVSPLTNNLQSIMREQLKWPNVFSPMQNYGARSLLRTLNAYGGVYKVLAATEIQNIIVANSQLRANVKAAKLLLPAPHFSLQEVVHVYNTLRQQLRIPKPVQKG